MMMMLMFSSSHNIELDPWPHGPTDEGLTHYAPPQIESWLHANNKQILSLAFLGFIPYFGK